MKTFCPECGPDVGIDEDGCCLACGNGATGGAVARIESKAVSVELRRRIRLAQRWIHAASRLHPTLVELDLRRPLPKRGRQ